MKEQRSRFCGKDILQQKVQSLVKVISGPIIIIIFIIIIVTNTTTILILIIAIYNILLSLCSFILYLIIIFMYKSTIRDFCQTFSNIDSLKYFDIRIRIVALNSLQSSSFYNEFAVDKTHFTVSAESGNL